MKFSYFFTIVFLANSVLAAETYVDGINALSDGDLDKAIRILSKFSNKDMSSRYYLNIAKEIKRKTSLPNFDYGNYIDELNKGRTNTLEKLGMIDRLKTEINGNSISDRLAIKNVFDLASKGDVNSIYKAGLYFQEGIGVRQNFREAAKFFDIAAQKGHKEALNSAGLYKRFGIGTKQDKKTAATYFKKSMEQKYAKAFYNLASLNLDLQNAIEIDLLADIGTALLNKKSKTYKKDVARFNEIKEKINGHIPTFHKAYLQKYIPFWLTPYLNKEHYKGRIAPEFLPYPPIRMVKKTPYFELFEDKNSAKPLMPDWQDFKKNIASNPEIEGKNLPYPAPHEQDVLSTLYYRPALPAKFHLSLTKDFAVIPAFVGDVFEIGVFSKLHETQAIKLGGHYSAEQADYNIVFESKDNSMSTDNIPLIKPLSIQTATTETWESQLFKAERPGISYIQFRPKSGEGFKYTLKIVIFGKE